MSREPGSLIIPKDKLGGIYRLGPGERLTGQMGDRKTKNLGQAKLHGDLGRKTRQLHFRGSS